MVSEDAHIMYAKQHQQAALGRVFTVFSGKKL